MDVKTFVSEALKQIIEGVQDAQSTSRGGLVNAELPVASTGNLISGGTYGMFTRVDFDIAVSAETQGGGKAGLTVFGIGAEAKGEHRAGYANRIQFSVPVRLPDGDRHAREPRPSRQDSGGWMGA